MHYILNCDLSDEQYELIKNFLDTLGCKYSIASSMKDAPVEEQVVFRFELFFEDKHQSVGLLQGLEDVCSKPLEQKLMEPFRNELPIPLGDCIQPSWRFWFTEKGLLKFANAIDTINQCIRNKGWEVRGSFLWMHESEFMYQDEFQVALEDDVTDKDSFVPFSRAVDMLHLFEEQYELQQ